MVFVPMGTQERLRFATTGAMHMRLRVGDQLVPTFQCFLLFRSTNPPGKKGNKSRSQESPIFGAGKLNTIM
jgi:hypothetical protein